MRNISSKCSIAVVQAEPILFDSKACVEKACALMREAAAHGAEFVVFPELFIPGYPFGMTFGFTVGSRSAHGRDDWQRYYEHSITADGEEVRRLGQVVKECGIYMSIGVSERDVTTGTLYNSNLLFRPDGTLDSVHRKLKPTGSERVVWGDADKWFFPTMDTPWGPTGSLICWESYMPLARCAMYEKGVTLYISPNTNDNPEWQSTIQHIALEGRCYFINCDMIIRKASYPDDLKAAHEVAALPEMVCRGGSCIVDPYGHYVTEPLWDQEGIIYADLDMTQVYRGKMEFDVCGHYARPDVLKLQVEDR